MIVQQPRARIALFGLVVLSVPLLSAADAPPEPGEVVRGAGAAGVTEVGRPLDVVRARAEALARERAVDALVVSVQQLASGQDPHHTEERKTGLEERARAAASGQTASWRLRYWSNGAVTARLAVVRDEILDEAARDE